ncbi:shikimate 5-dehydrogenase [Amycolatopsis mediterranei S699]|uniref:Shikimate dehydrogenase (NADP(+)) n=2 Tax=Amycolatopsis mediterranei TaxID=33910 RepID=A0A0H3D7T4_AMYMU|nr:shikimate dehydrogenase [Amycolatopsis mediterranei]ADJ46133.1 shikimate 5-dehydrogenase [Amycolatopsis mediterranei U32]AEK42921.1 shikimate 5-dehydrogenase [Amycolatopsis mediterranei S699]AFO77844.1 shikimate 5-dehydrogenase [Amycolatopsis mediterranei S699]AGT84972.1 shikimate 5-dehydrogenase [Amycolatopsis mediterranei RB]KDO05669.1 shikimate dehydrogenase [Amycolatopsis mediterranei]
MTSYLIGLVGTGIGPSASPALHEREADELGLRYVYRLLDLDVLRRPVAEVLAAARLAGFDGLNVTHPAKQAVVAHLDELSPEAAALGAVNTVVFRGGRAIGHNTDATGFARSLTRGLPDVRLDHVVLVGAGGAGAAVAHALLSLGTGCLIVHDVDGDRGARLAEALERRFGPGRAATGDLTAIHRADGLVHATPTGMAAHPGSPVLAELLHPRLWVADIVYRPLETALLAAARARGCRVLHGGGMVVFQAAESFRLFTGAEPDPARMLRHFDALEGEAARAA